MADKQLEEVMAIIMHSGNARGDYLAAIKLAQDGRIEDGEALLKTGKESLLKAHHAQTAMMTRECQGEGMEITMLLLHAQDHLMTTLTIKDLSAVFFDIGKKLQQLGG